jgi:hypothetical protein
VTCAYSNAPPVTIPKIASSAAALGVTIREGAMSAGLDLTAEILRQPMPLLLWMAWMVLLNLIVPLFFWRRTEGRVVPIVFLVNAMIMAQLYATWGYGKHLGLAHVVWFPMLAWLITRRRAVAAQGGAFALWILALVVTDAISLALDTRDVLQAFGR